MNPPPGTPDPGYLEMVVLVEALLDDLMLPAPDWCGISRRASRLASLAQARCDEDEEGPRVAGSPRS
jgi:hypothetical protein